MLMNPNKLTHGHNLLWESSRMMLPEHKELLQQHQQHIIKKSKPILDEQEIEQLESNIQMALSLQSLVQVTLFHPYEAVIVTGTIQKVDPYTKQIKLITSKGSVEWVPLDNIIHLDDL